MIRRGAPHRAVRRVAMLSVIGVALATLFPVAVTPSTAWALPDGNGAVIAIVIDDVVDNGRLSTFLRIDAALTFAVMPFAAGAMHADRRIADAGREVIAHLGVTSNQARTSGPRLGRGWSSAQVDAWVARALVRVPHAVGANNHMGSTTNVTAMRRLMAALVARNLFFLDSVTVRRSVAYAAALEAGMPSRINNNFIDGSGTVSSARSHLYGLALRARKQGSAIGIGHLQRATTAEALRQVIPVLERHGYRILPLSQVTSVPAPGSAIPRRLPR